MPQREVRIMSKEDPLDNHIHFHIHEIVLGRWLKPRSRIHTRIFTKLLPGLLLGTGVITALYFHWWR